MHSGFVPQCLTRYQGAPWSTPIGVTALCVWPWHSNTCLLLVQPMKNHPDITENVLTGTLRIKSSKQTSFFVQKILRMCQASICLQTEIFDKLLLYFLLHKGCGFYAQSLRIFKSYLRLKLAQNRRNCLHCSLSLGTVPLMSISITSFSASILLIQFLIHCY